MFSILGSHVPYVTLLLLLILLYSVESRRQWVLELDCLTLNPGFAFTNFAIMGK